MAAAAAIELFVLATALIEKIVPLVEKALKSGETTVEQQRELKAKRDALKAKLESGALGPAWVIPDRD